MDARGGFITWPVRVITNFARSFANTKPAHHIGASTRAMLACAKS